MTFTRHRFGHAAALAAILSSGMVAAQDLRERVTTLYASAAYEEVLAALPSTTTTPDLEIYRVSCLVALGRTEEAVAVIGTIVTANPAYQPDASPRILQLFRDTRRTLLPGIAKRVYGEARAALDRRDRDEAIGGFTDTLKVLDDPDLAGNEMSAELRWLASGFLDLSRALPDPKAVPPAPPPVSAVTETPAVPIRQALPSWNPPPSKGRQVDYHGTIRVTITAAGTVDHAVMLDPVEHNYDRLLVKAAREWRYKPATSNGIAVASEKVIEINLKPR